MAVFAGLVVLPMYLLSNVDANTPHISLAVLLFIIGFGIAGPKTIAGLAVRETFPSHSGLSGGLLVCLSFELLPPPKTQPFRGFLDNWEVFVPAFQWVFC